jgi:hypothetical protein
MFTGRYRSLGTFIAERTLWLAAVTQSLGELYIHGMRLTGLDLTETINANDNNYQLIVSAIALLDWAKTDHKHSDWLQIEWQPKSRTLSQSASVDNEPVDAWNLVNLWRCSQGSRPKGDRHSGYGSALAKLLESAGRLVLLSILGQLWQFSRRICANYPAQPEDFQRLIKKS